MTPEQEMLDDLLRQVAALRASMPGTLALVGALPTDTPGFDAMPAARRIATTALLKRFEQLEDTLASLFRAILRALGQKLKGLYALDIGNKMVELDDGYAWLAIVQLRNRLVHEYALDADRRLEPLGQAFAAIPKLLDVAGRAERVVAERDLLGGPA